MPGYLKFTLIASLQAIAGIGGRSVTQILVFAPVVHAK